MSRLLKIEGITVKFPNTPYKCQMEIMQKIIKSLSNRQNALLESPTGTGKTLALLCSTLAWHQQTQKTASQEKEKPIKNDVAADGSKKPKIFYLTRTHKQLEQIIRELNKTDYRSVKMAIFGGREQMCINNHARMQEDLRSACRKLGKKNSCSFKRELNELTKTDGDRQINLRELVLNELKMNQEVKVNDKAKDVAWNVSEIVDIGTKHGFCPYYASQRELFKEAEIIFCPYNYLIDPTIRKRMNLQSKLKDSILLFDEAHNIEDFCISSASFSVTNDDLITERNGIISASKEDVDPTYVKNCQKLIILYDRILKFIQTFRSDPDNLSSVKRGEEYHAGPWSGDDIYEKLGTVELIDEDSVKSYKQAVDDIIYPPDEYAKKPEGNNNMPAVSLECLEKLLLFAGHMFKNDKKYGKDFRFGLTVKPSTSDDEPVIRLNAWCMNAAVAFNDLTFAASSIILTSGTLSPMDTFESELGVWFHNNNRMETSHILPNDRMLIRSVGLGPTQKSLLFTFKNLQNKSQRNEILDDFGTLLVNVCESVPGGVLCFFPSYYVMNQTLSRFKYRKTLEKIKEIKKLFIESRDKNVFEKSMNGFFETVKDPLASGKLCTGAIFMAVYRGKLAEGIDFADDFARAVVCVGVPYPNVSSLDIQLKMDYNSEHCQRIKDQVQEDTDEFKRFLLPGFQWLNAQAYRSLNQALGRCIRHDKDWGCLLLVDNRLSTKGGQLKLSRWIRENIENGNDHNGLIKEIQSFSERLSNENEGFSNGKLLTTLKMKANFIENKIKRNQVAKLIEILQHLLLNRFLSVENLMTNKRSDIHDASTTDEESSENSSSSSYSKSHLSGSKSDSSLNSKRSLPKRSGSPSFKERRRITSARKKPTPYDRNKTVQKNKRSPSTSSGNTSRSTTPDSPFIRQTLKEHCSLD